MGKSQPPCCSWNWPEVLAKADYIRTNRLSWVESAISSRDVYEKSPTAEHLASCNTSLSILHQVGDDAAKIYQAHADLAKIHDALHCPQ